MPSGPALDAAGNVSDYGIHIYDRSQAPPLTVPASGAPVALSHSNVGTGPLAIGAITTSDAHCAVAPATTCGTVLALGAS